MSRKIWMGVAAALLVMVVMGAVAVGGVLHWQAKRTANWLAQAEKWYAAGDWPMARNNYRLYLTKVPTDGEAVLKFADANERILTDRRGSLELAANAYHMYLQHNRGNIEVEKRLLNVFKKAKTWEELSHYAGTFMKQHPEEVDFAYLRALALERAGHSAEAIEAYRALVAREDARPEAYGQLAVLLVRERNVTEAEAVVDKALEKGANDPETLREVARYYEALRDYSQADATLVKGLELRPNDSKLLVARARLKMQEKQLSEALTFAKAAVEAAPDQPDVLVTLAQIYALMENYNGALETLGRLTPEMQVDNPEALAMYADLLYSRDKLEEARAAVALYAEAYPTDQTLRDYFRARDLLASREPERVKEAVRLFQSITDRNPDWPPAQFLLAVSYIQSGETNRNRARIALEIYLKNNPTDDKARGLWQTITRTTPSPSEIRASARRLLATQDVRAEELIQSARQIMVTQDRASTQTDDLQLQKTLLERAIAREPAYPKGYQSLAEVLVAMGDYDGAIACTEKARSYGVSDEDLFLSRALVALARHDDEALRRDIEQTCSQANVTPNLTMDWAGFFALKGRRDLSELVLENAERRFGPELQGRFAVFRAVLSANVDPPAVAVGQAAAAEALAQGNEALKNDLRNARLDIARRLLMSGIDVEVDEALGLLKEIRTADPDNVNAKAVEAIALLRSTPPQLQRSQELLDEVKDVDPKNVTALLGLSELDLRKGNLQSAIEHARSAATEAPDSPVVNMQLARLYVKAGSSAEAQAKLDALSTAEPDNPDVLDLSIQNAIAEKRLDQAENLLVKLESTATDRPDGQVRVTVLRARLLAARGQVNDAEAVLKRQLTETPESLQLVSALAEMYAKGNRLDDAVALYEDYAKRHPDDAEPLVELARMYLAENREDAVSKASTALIRARVIQPFQPEATREMIRVQFKRKDLSEALSWCDKYLEQIPNEPSVLFDKAQLLAAQGKLPEALKAVTSAVEREPRVEYRAFKGWLHKDLREYREALTELESIYPNPQGTSGVVDLLMAEIYLGSGNISRARAFLEAASAKPDADPQRVAALRTRLGGESSS